MTRDVQAALGQLSWILQEYSMSECPCGSGRTFENCCGPYLNGSQSQWPETPEALMRARYSAHVLADIAFLKASYHPETRESLDWQVTERWAKQSQWLGLTLTPLHEEGNVAEIELKARYQEPGKAPAVHHEISQFERLEQDGRWYFKDARLPKVAQVRRETAKVGRNEPCPCGSGKKYKHCCLRG